MSAKLILDTAAMQEDFFEDTSLIGIVSAVPAYRFCWLMHEKLDMTFCREPGMDIILQIGKGKHEYFPVYQYCLLNGYRHLLYKLKTDQEVLLPEVKQLDYLWLVQGSTHETDVQDIIRHLRNIPDVQLAQSLPHDRLKNISTLLV